MKNIVLSTVTIFALSSFALAGGDITPVDEPIIETEEVSEIIVSNDQGLYLGLGYGSLKGEETYKWNPGNSEVSFEEDSRDFDQLLLQAGYKFNSYVAVEGRYWLGMNDLNGDWEYEGLYYNTDASLDSFGIYVKPMYPVTDAFDVYGLLGYATSSLKEDIFVPAGTLSQTTDLDGFSWGIGAAYSFNDNISIFADYVSLYDDTIDYDVYNASSEFTIDTVNIGVSYKF